MCLPSKTLDIKKLQQKKTTVNSYTYLNYNLYNMYEV